MKFLVVFFFLAASALAAPQADQSARILAQTYELFPDGNFNYNYQTENKISADATGVPKAIPNSNPPEQAEVIQGQFSWISPEGKTITVVYVADETGYRPKTLIS